jgi:hypothetical protein
MRTKFHNFLHLWKLRHCPLQRQHQTTSLHTRCQTRRPWLEPSSLSQAYSLLQGVRFCWMEENYRNVAVTYLSIKQSNDALRIVTLHVYRCAVQWRLENYKASQAPIVLRCMYATFGTRQGQVPHGRPGSSCSLLAGCHIGTAADQAALCLSSHSLPTFFPAVQSTELFAILSSMKNKVRS